MQSDPISQPQPGGPVFFDRRELNRILTVYGFMVAAGEWRDYGLETGRDHVAFAVFKRAAEQPVYRIEKRPELSRRQGAWSISGPGGHILKRGHDLDAVLRFFDRQRMRVVG